MKVISVVQSSSLITSVIVSFEWFWACLVIRTAEHHRNHRLQTSTENDK